MTDNRFGARSNSPRGRFADTRIQISETDTDSEHGRRAGARNTDTTTDDGHGERTLKNSVEYGLVERLQTILSKSGVKKYLFSEYLFGQNKIFGF